MNGESEKSTMINRQIAPGVWETSFTSEAARRKAFEVTPESIWEDLGEKSPALTEELIRILHEKQKDATRPMAKLRRRVVQTFKRE